MNIPLSVSVTGPEFQQIKVGVGHRLDVSSSGVLGMIVLQLITQILPVFLNMLPYNKTLFFNCSSWCWKWKQGPERSLQNTGHEGN